MTITEPLRAPADYERVLKEIELYFESAPEPGTEGI